MRNAVLLAMVMASGCAGVVRVQQPLAPLVRLQRAIEKLPASHAEFVDPGTANTHDLRVHLLAAARRLGVSFTSTPAREGVVGSVTFKDRAIYIDPELSYDGQTETLAHELAHLLEPNELRGMDGESEMFAEAVSALLTGDINASAKYLAQHKSHVGILKLYAREIGFAALVLRGE